MASDLQESFPSKVSEQRNASPEHWREYEEVKLQHSIFLQAVYGNNITENAQIVRDDTAEVNIFDNVFGSFTPGEFVTVIFDVLKPQTPEEVRGVRHDVLIRDPLFIFSIDANGNKMMRDCTAGGQKIHYKHITEVTERIQAALRNTLTTSEQKAISEYQKTVDYKERMAQSAQCCYPPPV